MFAVSATFYEVAQLLLFSGFRTPHRDFSRRHCACSNHGIPLVSSPKYGRLLLSERRARRSPTLRIPTDGQPVAIYAPQAAIAIKGVEIVGSNLWIANDSYFHTSTPNNNQRQRYALP
jgi:hypothetical protein